MKIHKKDKRKQNPFYGLDKLLKLYHAIDNRVVITNDVLNEAYKEAEKASEEAVKLFWILVFALGDVTDRQHHALPEKADKGGYGEREKFFTVVNWMKNNHITQYAQFLEHIVEYSGWHNLLWHRVKTKKNTEDIIKVYSHISEKNLEILTDFIVSYISKYSGNPTKLGLLAKRIVRIDNRLPKSKEARNNRQSLKMLYDNISKRMNLEILDSSLYEGTTYHKGLYDLRSQWIKYHEDYLFSTKKILEFGDEQYLQWYDNLPSEARRRVSKRCKEVNQWSRFFKLHDQWANYKEEKQEEKRKLKEKMARTNTRSLSDRAKLAELEKEAKVNVGASNILDEFNLLVREGADSSNVREFNLRADQIMNNMELKVPIVQILDISSSMNSTQLNGIPVHQYSSILATALALKNPDRELGNLMIRFGSKADVCTYNAEVQMLDSRTSNRFMVRTTNTFKKLVDREKDFFTNLATMRSFSFPCQGATRLDSVADKLIEWVGDDQSKVEEVQAHPVFLVISDGHFNGGWIDPHRAVSHFMTTMRQKLGWNGVLCIWDICSTSQSKVDYTDIPNVLHLTGWSLSNLNIVFTNIHDLDVIDAYTPLLSLYRSNRYDPIRNNVI